jgi:hypothetical protein
LLKDSNSLPHPVHAGRRTIHRLASDAENTKALRPCNEDPQPTVAQNCDGQVMLLKRHKLLRNDFMELSFNNSPERRNTMRTKYRFDYAAQQCSLRQILR